MWINVILGLLFSICLFGCSDADYENGDYWMNRDNGQMAAKAYQRAIKNHPKRWKNHVAAIEAIRLWNDRDAMIVQLRDTFFRFPDSTYSERVFRAGSTVLGETEYKKLTAPYAQQKLSTRLAKEGETPELLSDLVITSVHMQDTTATIDYYKKLLSALDGKDVPKNVQQELNFFIGPARMDWVKYDWIITNDPDNVDVRISRLKSIALTGKPDDIKSAISEIVSIKPELATDNKLLRQYGMACGVNTFNTRELVSGSDGCYSPDGNKIAFIRERGKNGYPDPYIYVANSNGSGATPILKGVQHYIQALAWLRFSPDGKWVYFYGSKDQTWRPGEPGGFHFYRVRTYYGAEPQKLTSEALLPVVPYFEDDGTIKIVREDVGSSRASVEIVSLNPNTKKQTVLSRLGEPVLSAVFSTNGDSLLFATGRGMFSRHVEGGKINVDIAWKVFNYPVLSPDGKYIAAKTTRGSSFRLDRTSGETIFIGEMASDIIDFGKGDKVLATRLIDGQPKVVEIDLGKVLPTAKFKTIET